MPRSKSLGALVLLAGIVVLLGVGSIQAAEKYEIDGSHSQVVFRVKHLGVSYNYGRFNDISGSYTFDPASPGQSSFDVTIKAESIDTHSEKRDQHLKSPDFFNAKQFPVIRLTSKSIKKSGENGFEAVGELSLHGVKKEVTVKIDYVGSGDDPWGNYRSGFEAKLVVDRTDFGMEYMPDGVGTEVTVMVNIEGIRK